MNDDIKLIVIEAEAFKNIIRETIKEEFDKLEQKLLQMKTPEKPYGDKLRVKDVAELLGLSRQTIHDYRKKGILPSPHTSVTGKAYWDKEQIIKAITENDLVWKYKL